MKKIPALFVALLLAAASLAAEDLPSRIAFGSCARQDKPQPIWDAIVASQPNLFIFLGDNIYADTEDMFIFQDKYKQLADKPGYKALLKTCPVLATWDDHDMGANDAGADYPKKQESRELFFKFFNVPKDSPRRQHGGVYDEVEYRANNKTLQVVLLDTRWFRSPLVIRPKQEWPASGHYAPNTAADATILGEEQWKWFEEQLRKPADLRIVATSIQAIPTEQLFEKWANYPAERTRLFKLIRETKANDVVLISGDRHLAEISALKADDPDSPGYPLYEVTSSGLTNSAIGLESEQNKYRVGSKNFVPNNFGTIEVNWATGVLKLKILDAKGSLVQVENLTLETLHPK